MTPIRPAFPRWPLYLIPLVALHFVFHIWFIFTKTPEAQLAAGGLAQKIFYFHVPSAWALYLAGIVCLVASASYLLRPSRKSAAYAEASTEVAVTFGMLVLVSGPLWAKKAWGVYWTWDPRLTTLLLTVLVYAALLLLRRFAGKGEAENRFAAAFGVLGTVLLPIVHYAVKLWGGNHPELKNGMDPVMRQALWLGALGMSLLCTLLIEFRARLLRTEFALDDLTEAAHEAGLLNDDSGA